MSNIAHRSRSRAHGVACVVPLVPLAVFVAACLDPTAGTERDGLEPIDGCSQSVAALELIAREVGDAALGPCGHVAVWREGRDRALDLYGPDHDLMDRVADENGYAGGVEFSASGDRLLGWSLRSDLGFGSIEIYPLASDLVASAKIDFAGPPTLLFGRDDRVAVVSTSVSGRETRIDLEDGTRIEPIGLFAIGGRRVVFAQGDPSDPSAPGRLAALDLDTRVVSSLGEIHPFWFEADTAAYRETLFATGDGTRAVIMRECRLADAAAPCATELARVLDTASGTAIIPPSGWRAPRIGPGPLVAAATADGTGLIAPDGTLRTLAGRSLVAVLDGHLLVSDGARLEAVDGTTGDATALGAGTLAATSREGHAAIVFDLRPSGETRVTLWRAGKELVTYERPPVPPQPLADVPPSLYAKVLFDDGVALISDGTRMRVLDPRGQEIATWDGTCVKSPLRRGRYLFVERCHAPNDLLVRVDLDSGRGQVLAEGHAFRFSVDPTGELAAFTLVPLSGTERELHAGRIGR